MRLKYFIESTIKEIQDGLEQQLYVECDDITVKFDIAITDADEPGIFVATFASDDGNRVAFEVPIRAYPITKGD